MNRLFIRRNITSISIIIFVIIFTAIQLVKPPFLYNKDGSLREFGIGRKNKTILPIWLVSLVISILSYLFVLCYLAYPKFKL